MKPVVSSLVALALAIAPMSAFAAKPAVHGKTAHVSKDAKKADAKDEKTIKVEKSSEKSESIVRVKSGKKPALHHASNVNLEGAGHKEPKAEKADHLVAASMVTKIEKHEKHEKSETTVKKADKDLPKLPDPKAGKPSKGGAEKGARKSSAKKSEAAASSSDDGETSRDEVTAELVARIRGQKSADEQSTEERTKSVAKVAHEDAPAHLEESMTKAKAEAAESAREEKEKGKAHGSAKPCSKDVVEVVRGPEMERFALTKCDGSIAPLAIEHLSVLIRPGGTARPTQPFSELAKRPGQEVAHGIRRVDGRLVERIQALADHFGKPGSPAKLSIISGYRPASVGSMHSTGRAIDFRLEGVKNEDVVAFCKTLNDTGCGYYPNSSFVHVDVRDAGAGHVTWIDASGPGETPRYVASWPEPGSSAKKGLEHTSAVTRDPLVEEGENILRAHRPGEASEEQ